MGPILPLFMLGLLVIHLPVIHDSCSQYVIFTVLGSPGSNREPRLCVQLLRQRQELLSAKSPLQKLLDNLQQSLEKKDPQQFFAWPVTDQIAPGYSQIIHQPMDFSTMHQKIEDNNYGTLKEYVVSKLL